MREKETGLSPQETWHELARRRIIEMQDQIFALEQSNHLDPQVKAEKIWILGIYINAIKAEFGLQDETVTLT